MKAGWYPWVNRDGDQLGVLHYFEVVAGNPEWDDEPEVFHPLCGMRGRWTTLRHFITTRSANDARRKPRGRHCREQ